MSIQATFDIDRDEFSLSVDVEIPEQGITALFGPSGCGKTTLLRVIADLEAHTSGDIKVNSVTPAEARAARSYGYVFQAPALYPSRTVEQNVSLPLEIMGYQKGERKQLANQYLDLVNLNGFEGKYPWQLSGGMQQRVSIARALSFEPKLLLICLLYTSPSPRDRG